MVNLDQILYVASFGWRKGYIRFLRRLDQNSYFLIFPYFHGNWQFPYTYNGKNVVQRIETSFLIRSLLNLQVTRTTIKSTTILSQIRLFASQLLALEWWKIFPQTYNGENVVRRIGPSPLIKSSSNLQNQGNHKNLDEFEFPLDQTIRFGVTCPWVLKNTIFDLVQSIAFLVLIGSLLHLQIIWTGIKYRMSSNSGQIRLSKFPAL